MRMILSVLGILAALTPMGAGGQEVWGEPSYGFAFLEAGFEPDPHQVSLRAGGNIDAAASLGGDCTGHIASRPDYSLTYGSAGHPLIIFVIAEANTTLVVRDPSGSWLCSDDFDGHDPAVGVEAPDPGPYQIWVGVFDADAGNPEVALFISTQIGEASSSDGPGIEWGDNTSSYADNGQCDDPRFAGPGIAGILLDGDRYHDASDCRRLYEEGQIYLR